MSEGLRAPDPDPPVDAPAPRREIKKVTVLFADIAGSTALIERKDAEEALNLLQPVVAAMIQAVTRYGGSVLKQMGDGIMAVFGVPVTQEDHAIRACHAALDMQAAVARLAEARRDAGPAVRIRVGLNSGSLVVSEVRQAGHVGYDVTGATVHLASRMESTAPPGSVCVAEPTYARIHATFECDDLGWKSVKGIAKPVRVFRLARPRAASRTLREPVSHGVHASLVGREREVARLMDAFAACAAGSGAFVLLRGEAGIGKTRLMTEFRARVSGQAATWLEGSCSSHGRTVSYAPFIGLIKSYVGLEADEGQDEAWAMLKARIEGACPGQEELILPYLAVMLGIQVQEPYAGRVAYLDGEALGHHVLRAGRLFFECLARERTVVMVLEDLHWIDATSAALLEHLLPLLKTSRLLICALCRRGERGKAEGILDAAASRRGSRCVSIDLEPLCRADSAALLDRVLIRDPRTERVRQAVLDRADGNPFFIEELLRALINAETLVWNARGGGWAARAGLEELVLPDSIQAVVMSRVDRLEERLEAVLQVASVIGPAFSFELLDRLLADEHDVSGCLEELERLELVVRERGASDTHYRFCHALAHEAVYDSITLQRRLRLHERVADGIEALHQGRLEERFGVLAFHYTRSRQWDKAQRYLIKAGDQASQLAADSEALHHYAAAVAAYGRAFGRRWDPVERATIERKLAEIYSRRGDRERTVAHLRYALFLLRDRYPATRLQVRRSVAVELARQALHRLLPAAFVSRPGRSITPAQEERLRIHEVMSWFHYFVDQERLILGIVKSLNCAERLGFLEGVAKGSAALGYVCDVLGWSGPAGWYHRRALALAARFRHPPSSALALHLTGLHYAYRGHLRAAVDHHERAAQTAAQCGDLHAWASAMALKSFVLCARGEFDQMRELGRGMARLGEETGMKPLLRWGSLVQGAALSQAGRRQEGEPLLQESMRLAEAASDYQCLAKAGAELGLSWLRGGKLREAIALLEAVCRRAQAARVRGHNVAALSNALAEARVRACAFSSCEPRAAALRRARKAARCALRQGRICRMGLCHAMRIMGALDSLSGRPRAAQAWWQRSLQLARRQDARHDVALTTLDMAGHRPAPA